MNNAWQRNVFRVELALNGRVNHDNGSLAKPEVHLNRLRYVSRCKILLFEPFLLDARVEPDVRDDRLEVLPFRSTLTIHWLRNL